MSIKFKLFAALATMSLVLGACGKTEEKEETTKQHAEKTEKTDKHEETAEHEDADYAAVYKEAVAELEKAKEGKEVDFDKVIKSYEEHLQSLVQKRDAELESTNDQHITAALAAGKEGSMDKVVVKQVFDKLMQKVFYTTMKHEFTEVTENWGKTEEVKEEMEEAKNFYSIIQSTVQKRDAAYGTTMEDAIAGGFAEMEKAIEANDELGFQLGKQVVDKTLMKTFYLATGATPNGYATKAADEAKTDAVAAKIEQAEGWAFYQSLTSYMMKNAPEADTLIQKQFDLQSDVEALDPVAINKAFVRGFAQTAINEYHESEETWGEDKSVITGLEGALFLDIISSDVKTLLGEEAQKTLTDKAQKYIEATKAKDQAAGEELLNEILTTTQMVIEKAK
ncbi:MULTISPECIES: hypothetical protein [unclassified Bacillus (in: firmicutes)]|uniref:hypothetical protein n=1 Tax=unclassified Bacillus (in: firmicutes) TaxID=185979 RepID=UPI0008F1F1A2|nr:MULTISPECIES: hypothetical protein [unclassified Bacillus (in: firmicutes)]SFB16899.1 hypothetical protein SAMN02799634_10784 [Bacillus sp. UNCCL13]SFQ77779.1 hypothetical protein SAMN04488577_1556 [Bacillus sp. cl95]